MSFLGQDLKEDQGWVIPGTRLSLSVRNQARVCLGFPGGSDGKESAYIAGDRGSIPGSGKFPGEGNGYPL